ncbi:hypothetical protein KEM52_003868, partial [Ascosphaera acerosa]
HISRPQRQLVWRSDAADLLRESPITVSLGKARRPASHAEGGENSGAAATEQEEEQEYTLRPLNHADIPRTKHLKHVLRLLRTPDDWQRTLLPFLAGLRAAGRVVAVEDWEWIVRTAGRHGQHRLLVAAARQPKRTGLRLGDVAVARQFFLNFHDEAVAAMQAGRGEATTATTAEESKEAAQRLTQLLRSAMGCAQLLNTPDHAPARASSTGGPAPARLPELIGVLLELAAAAARADPGAVVAHQPIQALVRDYAEKLLSAWAVGDLASADTPDYIGDVNARALRLAPVWHALGLAGQVDAVAADRTLATALQARRREAEARLDAAVRRLREQTEAGKVRSGVRAAEAVGFRS